MRLMTPCSLNDKRQIKSKIALLKKYVRTEYPFGLEARVSMNDFSNPSVFESGISELKKLPKSVFLSLHGPIELKKGSKKNFFASEQGFQNLVKTVELANAIGAELINIHAHLFLSFDEAKTTNRNDLVKIKKASMAKVKKDLERLIREVHPPQKICIENVPYCLTADTVLDPREMLYEFCFVDPYDFREIVAPEKNIFATIDVCHLAQVYDSSQLLEKTKKLGRGLGHIHLSDTVNIWQPFISLVEEGVIPGKGRIGERVFKELLGYFLKYSEKHDLSILIEVHDKDFTKLAESKESFKIVMRWLEELKRR